MPYDQQIVFSKTSGHPGALTDAAPVRVLDGAPTITATHGPLLYRPCTNDDVAGSWTLLAKGASAAAPAGRTAVMRDNPLAGPMPFGVQWA